MKTPIVPPMAKGRRAAELAAADLLVRAPDLVVAGSFSFNASRSVNELRMCWIEHWPGGPQPPDMLRPRPLSLGEPVFAECERVVPLAETLEQAPAIAHHLGYRDSPWSV